MACSWTRCKTMRRSGRLPLKSGSMSSRAPSRQFRRPTWPFRAARDPARNPRVRQAWRALSSAVDPGGLDDAVDPPGLDAANVSSGVGDARIRRRRLSAWRNQQVLFKHRARLAIGRRDTHLHGILRVYPLPLRRSYQPSAQSGGTCDQIYQSHLLQPLPHSLPDQCMAMRAQSPGATKSIWLRSKCFLSKLRFRFWRSAFWFLFERTSFVIRRAIKASSSMPRSEEFRAA